MGWCQADQTGRPGFQLDRNQNCANGVTKDEEEEQSALHLMQQLEDNAIRRGHEKNHYSTEAYDYQSAYRRVSY